MKQNNNTAPILVTAGSTYLDIDAYACAVAMAELLRLEGYEALAYSNASANYSVTPSLSEDGQVLRALPPHFRERDARYVIVDVSDPDYIKDSVPLDRVREVYDHHVGFEAYWQERIGDGARIEFIGAAATLIYREWTAKGLKDRMSPATARLLVAAILDNTLNLTSSNTTKEDREAFAALCAQGEITPDWCAAYFTEVQSLVEADLKNALMGDLKRLRDTEILPPRMAQLCVWDTRRILDRLPEIRGWFEGPDGWMINIIDLQEKCSYFVCDDTERQGKIGTIFGVTFEDGVAKTPVSYLRKQIIKKACY
ncbi:MAG: DHH family protein [Clostridia bacterium]|nr:DHH family protein [Clostridia bacterium]